MVCNKKLNNSVSISKLKFDLLIRVLFQQFINLLILEKFKFQQINKVLNILCFYSDFAFLVDMIYK